MSELIKLSYHKTPDKRKLQNQNDITGVAEYADLRRFQELIEQGYEISSSQAPENAKPGLIGVTKTFKFHNGRKDQKLTYLLHNRNGKLVIDDFKPFEIRGRKVTLYHDDEKGDLMEVAHDGISYHPYTRKDTNDFVFAFRKVEYFNESMLAAIQEPKKNMAPTKLAGNHDERRDQRPDRHDNNNRNFNNNQHQSGRLDQPLGRH